MSSRLFSVTIPIAGHAVVEVSAANEAEAIEAALNNVMLKDVDTWEALRRFSQGNLLYCPQPWEIEAEDLGEDSDA